MRKHQSTTRLQKNTQKHRDYNVRYKVQWRGYRLGIRLPGLGSWRSRQVRNERGATHHMHPASAHQEWRAKLPFRFKKKWLWCIGLLTRCRSVPDPYLDNRTSHLRSRWKLRKRHLSLKWTWKHFWHNDLESGRISLRQGSYRVGKDCYIPQWSSANAFFNRFEISTRAASYHLDIRPNRFIQKGRNVLWSRSYAHHLSTSWSGRPFDLDGRTRHNDDPA